MKTYLYLPAIISSILLIGCSSSDKFSSSEQTKSGSPYVPVLRSHAPAAVKQNATRIEAIIDTVIFRDNPDYRLSIRLKSYTGVEGADNLFEGAHQLALEPGYVLNDQGKLDLQNERNKNIFTLQMHKRGDAFAGIISRMENGNWKLIEVFDK